MLVVLLAAAGVCLGVVAALPPAPIALAALAIGMGTLGMGNGSVFQMVPNRFASSVGIMTGLVGAAGGLGGFLLPSILGVIKDRTGSFGYGFSVVTLLMFVGVGCLVCLRPYWRRSWPAEAAMRSGVISKERALQGEYASAATQ